MGKKGNRRTRIVFRVIAAVIAGVVLLVFLVAAAAFAGGKRQGLRVFQEYSDLDNGGQFEIVDGFEMHYREMKPADMALSKTPLVLIHGLMGSSKDFEHIQPALALQRVVIAVDLPGFGRSDKDPALDFSKASMSRLVAGLMASLGYERYEVLGHSMGGEVAQRIALEYPDQVTGLILLDSAGLAEKRQIGRAHV